MESCRVQFFSRLNLLAFGVYATMFFVLFLPTNDICMYILSTAARVGIIVAANGCLVLDPRTVAPHSFRLLRLRRLH